MGDIIGRAYEFRPIKTKDFPLFSEASRISDDTVMTLAVAEGIMNGWEGDDEEKEREVVKSMRRLGRLYPDAGYGAGFAGWLMSEHPSPYNSFGNGSAMRVSSVAWFYETLEDVMKYSELTARVTHSHPEGIKGAQATASAIFLARTGSSKQTIKEYIQRKFGYDLDRSIAEIRPVYRHAGSCQESVPEAIIAFLEGENFEDVVRTAVSLGGDSDTQAAIAGGIAEAYYRIPPEIKQKAFEFLDDELTSIVKRYREFLNSEYILLTEG